MFNKKENPQAIFIHVLKTNRVGLLNRIADSTYLKFLLILVFIIVCANIMIQTFCAETATYTSEHMK